MRQPRITAAEVERFVDHLGRRDRRSAVRQALGLLEAGASVQDLVQDLLGPAQAEVGRRWATNRWSVADEHAATAISDAVLAAVAWRVEAAQDQGHVVVTCAEASGIGCRRGWWPRSCACMVGRCSSWGPRPRPSLCAASWPRWARSGWS